MATLPSSDARPALAPAAGIAWKCLSHDFPPRTTVYYLSAGAKEGIFEQLGIELTHNTDVDQLNGAARVLRRAAGRAARCWSSGAPAPRGASPGTGVDRGGSHRRTPSLPPPTTTARAPATTRSSALTDARARPARTTVRPRRPPMQPEQQPAIAARPRYQGRARIAAMLGVSSDLLEHWIRRHPDRMPEPDAELDEGRGRVAPLWLPGRDAEWQAWRTSVTATRTPIAAQPGRIGGATSHHLLKQMFSALLLRGGGGLRW
ncbi:hypothetical protein [Nonomuraea basaltis]|uniref:hypothetical protein n=1 Tax=Nonomuraea basaltis TaxID=2495887 RepID=UPI00110C58C9|nr:hypothetical protein [Nonomuraea basaltis]TMR99178.1 hypothetical protein EJK15_08520 [Nonomuraea basaltis]